LLLCSTARAAVQAACTLYELKINPFSAAKGRRAAKGVVRTKKL